MITDGGRGLQGEFGLYSRGHRLRSSFGSAASKATFLIPAELSWWRVVWLKFDVRARERGSSAKVAATVEGERTFGIFSFNFRRRLPGVCFGFREAGGKAGIALLCNGDFKAHLQTRGFFVSCKALRRELTLKRGLSGPGVNLGIRLKLTPSAAKLRAKITVGDPASQHAKVFSLSADPANVELSVVRLLRVWDGVHLLFGHTLTATGVVESVGVRVWGMQFRVPLQLSNEGEPWFNLCVFLGFCASDAILHRLWNFWRNTLNAELWQRGNPLPPPVDTALDSIAYYVKRVGAISGELCPAIGAAFFHRRTLRFADGDQLLLLSSQSPDDCTEVTAVLKYYAAAGELRLPANKESIPGFGYLRDHLPRKTALSVCYVSAEGEYLLRTFNADEPLALRLGQPQSATPPLLEGNLS